MIGTISKKLCTCCSNGVASRLVTVMASRQTGKTIFIRKRR